MTNYEDYGKCDNCGSPIKHIFSYSGKTYGSKCIEKVTGGRFDLRNVVDGSVYNPEEAQRRREAADQNETERVAGLVKLAKVVHDQGAPFISLLKTLLIWRQYQHALTPLLSDNGKIAFSLNRAQEFRGFVVSIIEDLEHPYFPTPVANLPVKALRILSDIYAKEFGGRRGSKKYDSALEKFDAAFELASEE